MTRGFGTVALTLVLATMISGGRGIAAQVQAPPGTEVHPEPVGPPAAQGDANGPYLVRVADGLVISVWKEPDFSGPVIVGPNGMITVPVVGEVHVAGLTTAQVQDIMTEKLRPFVTEPPQVTVIVRDIKSRTVYLGGSHPTKAGPRNNSPIKYCRDADPCSLF